MLKDAPPGQLEEAVRTVAAGDSLLAPAASASECSDAGKRKGTRPGWSGGAYAHMRRVLSTDLGSALY